MDDVIKSVHCKGCHVALTDRWKKLKQHFWTFTNRWKNWNNIFERSRIAEKIETTFFHGWLKKLKQHFWTFLEILKKLKRSSDNSWFAWSTTLAVEDPFYFPLTLMAIEYTFFHKPHFQVESQVAIKMPIRLLSCLTGKNWQNWRKLQTVSN